MLAMTKDSNPVPFLDPDGDDAWDLMPTALEAARYSEELRLQADATARRKEKEAESARKIFGECLLKLVKLGMKETKARSMLGKWRAQAKDDALLVRVVEQAHHNGTPDPIGYVTKALDKSSKRAATVEDLTKGKWHLIGWEAPRQTPNGNKWRESIRGQVWRNPYGKMSILPAPDGTVPPTLEEDPGVEI